jgi:hypothetical protein
MVRDFLIGTSTAVISHVSENGTKMKKIMTEHDQSIYGLASHPFEVSSTIKGTVAKTENIKYALRVANPRAPDKPARGWPPEVRIVMTP